MNAYEQACKAVCALCAQGDEKEERHTDEWQHLSHGEDLEWIACTAPTPMEFMETQAKRIAELEQVLSIAETHVDELRDAWQRGSLCEIDGLGGTRSNRNMDVSVAIFEVLRPQLERE